ncbi:MAG: exosortase family protein XrtF, partial [Flammeovirgaceae bacterium]
YFIFNIVYGTYIENTKPEPDVFTRTTATQTAWILRKIGHSIEAIKNKNGPTVFIQRNNQPILSIYEGCNGINVIIVFVSFIVAFAGGLKKKLSFLALGIFIINSANVVRIALLYFVAIRYQVYFYFIHKYVFTLVLYVIVVILWLVYVNKLNDVQKLQRPSA